MCKHVGKYLVWFKWFCVYRPQSQLHCYIILGIKNCLGNKNQNIQDEQVFDNGGKRTGAMIPKITHWVKLGDIIYEKARIK